MWKDLVVTFLTSSTSRLVLLVPLWTIRTSSRRRFTLWPLRIPTLIENVLTFAVLAAFAALGAKAQLGCRALFLQRVV